jgi:hypothetical protein
MYTTLLVAFENITFACTSSYNSFLPKSAFPYHSTSIHWASLGDSFNMQYPQRDGYRFSTNIKDYEEQTCLVSSSWLVLALCK